MHLIMQEQDDIDAKEDKSIEILACIAKMQIEEDTNANPKRGESKFGRRRIDGQTKHVNQCVETYLRCTTQSSPRKWIQ